jgi:energy-coupling factor transporter transmembrane protein EcfT
MTRLDPLVKLCVAFVVIAFATLNDRPAELAALAALLAVLLLAVERVPPRRFALALAPFLFFAVTSSWIYALAPSNVYGWSGWQVALAVGLRTVAVGMVSMLFAFTTEPGDLARALVHRARLPRRFVFGALAAIQFLPVLAEEARLARLVARAALPPRASRLAVAMAGLRADGAIALLAGAIRRAGTAALAMELRGLSATSGAGSTWRVPRVGWRDAVFATGVVIALASLRAAGVAFGRS